MTTRSGQHLGAAHSSFLPIPFQGVPRVLLRLAALNMSYLRNLFQKQAVFGK
jgi:hypothetical protein